MRLDSAPPDLARTREALHAIAEQVLAPARVRATGTEIALGVELGWAELVAAGDTEAAAVAFWAGAREALGA
jgi:hypothetical protein